MFDKSKLADVLVRYKKDFLPKRWEREKYKWEAVKCFQDNWDAEADDLPPCWKNPWPRPIICLLLGITFPKV